MDQRISPPQEARSDVDLQFDCQTAIDVPVRDLVDEIIQAGWPPKIAYAAMKNVIEQQILAYVEDPDPADDPVEGRGPLSFPLTPF
jgi:hypothetical protein